MAVYGTYGIAEVVVPDDANDLPKSPGNLGWAIYVGGAGDVAVKCKVTQQDIIFHGMLAGTIVPVTVDRVLATGTTATNLVACA